MLCRFFVGKGKVMNNFFIIAAADNNQEIMDFLQKFQDWIQHADIWSWIWKNVVWAIVRGLYTLSSLAEKSVDTILTLGGFLNYGPIQNIYIAMQVIAGSVVAIMLIIVGYKKMFNSPIKIKQVVFRTVMVFCLMVELPGLMTWGLDISKQFFNESKTAGEATTTTSSLSFALIKDNTTDLAYVASKDFKPLEEGDTIINAPGQSGVIVPEKNTLTEEMFKQIPMSDVIIPKDAKEMGSRAEYLGYQMTYDYDGTLQAAKIENGFLDMFKEGVFRYPAQFPSIIMGLITLGLAYMMALFVLAQNMVELGFKKILFPLVAASDIETGQRTKVYLQDIFQALMVIPLTGISLRVFTIYYAFVATLGLNWFLFSIASVVGMLVCMNGTNTIAKHFGVDVGVKDGLKGMLMMMAAGKLGKDLVSGTGKTAKSVANKGLEATEEGFKQAKKSIRDTKDNIDKGANKIGESMGHLSERGVSGFVTDKKEAMKDAASAKKEAAKESIDSTVAKATKPIKDVKDNFNKGVDSGIVEGSTKNAKAKEPAPTTRDSVRNEDDPQQKGYGKVNPGKEQSFGNDNNNKGETNQFGNTKVATPKDSESNGISKSLAELKVDSSSKVEGKAEGGNMISTKPSDSKQDTLKAKLDNQSAIKGNSPTKIEVTPHGTPNLNAGTLSSNSTTTEGKSVSGSNGTTQQQVNVKNENQVKQDVQQVTNQNKQVSENYQTTTQNHTRQETTQTTNTTNQNNQSNKLANDNYDPVRPYISVGPGSKSSTGRSKGHGEFTVNFDDLFNGKE